MSPTGQLERKLAAIFYADVAEYSRLTGDDEEGTHLVLRDYLDLIAATVDSHNGQGRALCGGWRCWLISARLSMR